MGHRREDVVATALGVLDRYGLADLTMRRLGAELGVRASALYHHFPDKQHLLAAVADELLARRHPVRADLPWAERVTEVCRGLRETLLAWTDAAELVATVQAYGLGARAPYDDLRAALDEAGLPEDLAHTAARTLLHLVLGHTTEEQLHLQAVAAGALPGEPRLQPDFDLGLSLVLDGLRVRAGADAPR